jgi:DnaJ-class molecular chaperone
MRIVLLVVVLLLLMVLAFWRFTATLKKEEAWRQKRCPTCLGCGRKELPLGSTIPGPEECPSCQGTGMRRAA